MDHARFKLPQLLTASMMTIDQAPILGPIQMWLDDLQLKSVTSSLEDELIFS